MLHRSGSPLPEYIVRRRRIANGVMTAVTIVFFLSMCGRMPAPIAKRELIDWLGVGVLLVTAACYLALVLLEKRRMRRRLETAEFTLCTRCAYDISSLERTASEGDRGREVRCPECGALICARDARVLWREYMAR